VPLIPVSSASIASLHANAAANQETGLPDTIVVRGYPGPPIEILEQANEILAAYPGANPIPAANINALLNGPVADSPWRIYLSAGRDCWVEVPSWGRCVAHMVAEASTDRVDAWTVWLRTLNPANGRPERYRVVRIEDLDPDGDRFVSGRLVEDYLARGAANAVVWDEQQFGPTTGKLSVTRCF
jgi:hypothetical protein